MPGPTTVTSCSSRGEPARIAWTSIASNDAPALERVGHALKGSLANLAAPTASKIAAELETMGKTGDLVHAAKKIGGLEAELVRVVEELEGMCLVAAQ